MLKKDIIRLFHLLTSIKNNPDYKDGALRFKYKNAYNLKSIENEISALKEVEKPIVELETQLNEKKLEILRKYARLDENGEFIIENGKYTFESKEKETNFIKEFFDETKDLTKKLNEEMDKILEIQKEESGVKEENLLKYELKELPEKFSDKDLEILMDLHLIIDDLKT